MEPNLEGQTARPLRYWPAGTDFVITNGSEFFNRPLYCMNSAFRIDGGDKPEFSLYLPGCGGNLRLGIRTTAGATWLHDAQHIVTRYRPGSLVYEITDPLLGKGKLLLTVLPMSAAKGLIARVEFFGNSIRHVRGQVGVTHGTPAHTQLICAFGGGDGVRGRRGGDIGCEREPVSRFFQLRPEQCRGHKLLIASNMFILQNKPGTIAGVLPPGAKLAISDATRWNNLSELFACAEAGLGYGGNEKAADEVPGQDRAWELPVAMGITTLWSGQPMYLAVQQIAGGQRSNDTWWATVCAAKDLPDIFAAAEKHRSEIASKIVAETPDPFVNAAVAALCIAADAIWDEQQGAFMHGAVAWRSKLLGWRGPYAGDALGWHDRARKHFSHWAGQQVTNPVPEKMPPPDVESNLARSHTALHSNGALSTRHYDMNLVYVDALLRHLLWTGDIEFARQLWPVLERHFAWERRLFRRPFADGNLPLYEAYAAIWASDDIQYHGGGVAYASAYNYWHNKMAARLAQALGKDPAPYEHEAELIWGAMRELLWLKQQGWFAEFKDWLGLQLVHPSCGVWSVYHTIDSGAATPFEAWQMTRYVDTQIPHIPVHGPGVPDDGLFTISTTTWMPYTWSVNNVVMAEALHTALAYWQANRPDSAFRLFKGALLDSMYMGLCPGNLGMTTPLDVARREAQRDFADAIGVCARALVEGLFGIRPDALGGELLVRPGLPRYWTHARINHPDFDFAYSRVGVTETYVITQRFRKTHVFRLHAPALRDRVVRVTVNGEPVPWRVLEDSVGIPRIELTAAGATNIGVQIEWAGGPLPAAHAELERVNARGTVRFSLRDARLVEIADPQSALSEIKITQTGLTAKAAGCPGHRTVFAKLNSGQLSWWVPVTFEIEEPETSAEPASINWRIPLPGSTRFELVDLTPFFNDAVTQIFRNEYLSPRSPFCSLAIPKQGIGSWCRYQEQFHVDDSGLRTAAAKANGRIFMPKGVPFMTPTNPATKNIVFVSQWDNYPNEVTVPLPGRARRAYLLMAGSTNPMQSRLDNGEVIVTYDDGSTTRFPLHNPTTWWPIDQDYFIDDYAFLRPEPIPPRVDLKTGMVRVLDAESFKGKGGKVEGGAATVLGLAVDPNKELRSLTVRALANEVVIGLMAVTLEAE